MDRALRQSDRAKDRAIEREDLDQLDEMETRAQWRRQMRVQLAQDARARTQTDEQMAAADLAALGRMKSTDGQDAAREAIIEQSQQRRDYREAIERRATAGDAAAQDIVRRQEMRERETKPNAIERDREAESARAAVQETRNAIERRDAFSAPTASSQERAKDSEKPLQHIVDRSDRLESKRSDDQAAQEMVDRASSRGWSELKVEGSEHFKAEVFQRAAERGMEVKGYAASDQERREADQARDRADKEEAARRKAEAFRSNEREAAKRYPELAGAVAAVAAIERKVEADRLSAEQRAYVMQRVREAAAAGIAAGHTTSVEVQQRQAIRQVEPQQRKAERELER